MTANHTFVTVLVAVLLVASSGSTALAATDAPGTQAVHPTDAVTVQNETQNETTTENQTVEEEEATGPSSPLANITFTNQTSNGSAVVVERVSINTTKPDGGFVVIHRAQNITNATNDTARITKNETGEVLGHSTFLPQGTYNNLTVQLNQTVNESQQLIAVVYKDTRANEEFQLDVDQQIVVGETIVADAAFVNISETAAGEATVGNETTEGA